MDGKTEAAFKRYEKDVELYHGEIEDIKKKISEETDERAIKHLNRMLLETQRALANVLSKISQIEEQRGESL